MYNNCFHSFSDTPRISLTMSQTLDGDIIRKGDTVYLHCEVRANPAVHTVEWTRNEVRIKSYFKYINDIWARLQMLNFSFFTGS